MQKQIEGQRSKTRQALAQASLWLRRVMPRVAIVSGMLLAFWLLFGDTQVFRQSFIGPVFGWLVFCAVLLTCIYYGVRCAG
jgi:hypothetical protein